MPTRILTTHTGSLPRPRDLVAMLQQREEGRPPADAVFHARVRAAVLDAVRKQTETGLSIIDDGEQGRADYTVFAGRVQVDTNIVWHKLRSLVEGARLASQALWPAGA